MNIEENKLTLYLRFDIISCRINSSSLATSDDEGKHRRLDDVQFHDCKMIDVELRNRFAILCQGYRTIGLP
jgi:hypothetical protein